jgi:hypothetical protein
MPAKDLWQLQFKLSSFQNQVAQGLAIEQRPAGAC